MKNTLSFSIIMLIGIIYGCGSSQKNSDKNLSGHDENNPFDVIDSAFFGVVSKDARLEVLGEGYVWSEGPVWVPELDALLFSDVPANTVYKWTENEGVVEYLKPSGYTGETERGGEPGSNGLVLGVDNELVLCQHGDRRMARMDAPLDAPEPRFVTLAGVYEGKRFNSPNDACYDSHGNLYFTDPPYGLVNNMEDSAKEIPFQGVYLVRNSGEVVLLVDSLTRPNGIAFTPDEKKMIVANSDPQKPHWYIFDVRDDGLIENGKIYHSAEAYKAKYKGLSDGLKIDSQGNVFATGPGGIWIFNPSGKFLGIIKTGQATANCAFGADENTLFITAHRYLMRIKLR